MRGRYVLALWLLFGLLGAGCARPKPASAPRPVLLAPPAKPTLTRLAAPPATSPAHEQPGPMQAVTRKEPRPTLTPTHFAEVHLPIVSSPEESPTPEEATPPTPGSDASIALVREYLEALGQGDLKEAYKLLHESYQAQVPYDDYVKGYSSLAGLELHVMEAIRADDYKDIVRAGITLITRKQGEMSRADWWATFEVLVTRGKPPYQRSITYITMQRVQEGER